MMKPEKPCTGEILCVMGPVVYVPGQMTTGIMEREGFVERINEAFAPTDGRCLVQVERPGRILILDPGVGLGSACDESARILSSLSIGAIIGRAESTTPAFTPRFIQSATRCGIVCCELTTENHTELIRVTNKFECDGSVDLTSLEGGVSNYFSFRFQMDEAHRQALLTGTWSSISA